MSEMYIRVEDIKKVSDPYKDHDVPIFELVRCKDCKHWLQRSAEVYRPVGIEGCACDSWIRITQENDYCSRGERRE